MVKKYYFKEIVENKTTNPGMKRIIQYSGIGLVLLGISIIMFYSLPVIFWQLLLKSAYAKATSPVPPPFILTPELIHTLEKEQTDKSQPSYNGGTNNISTNWILAYNFKKRTITPSIKTYKISIPELEISEAVISTVDFDVTKHLVQYWNTPIPPLAGNTVIFGHSSLPQMFETNNYKTIFANAHRLKTGDIILIHLDNETYTYEIIRVYVTKADDLSVLKQEMKGSYLTIVTCSPPGTTWERLIIKARLTNI